MTTQSIRLGDLAILSVHYTTHVGGSETIEIVAGETPDAVLGRLLDLTGTLDAEGGWTWDGQGSPKDLRGNTIATISVSIDLREPLVCREDEQRIVGTVNRVNVYEVDGVWYAALWAGDEYDSCDSIPDVETLAEAIAWVTEQFPGAEVRQVPAE